MRFPPVHVFAIASSIDQMTRGNAHGSLCKLTLLNPVHALLSQSAKWSAVPNEAVYYTQVAFLNVCDTRSLYCSKIVAPAMA